MLTLLTTCICHGKPRVSRGILPIQAFTIPLNIIQILTGTVMKYHVSVDSPRELYFPQGIIFSRSAQHGGKITVPRDFLLFFYSSLYCHIKQQRNTVKDITIQKLHYLETQSRESQFQDKWVILVILPLLAPPTRDISPVQSISVILDGQNEWFPQHFMCSTITTKFGNKTRSLRTKQYWTQTWQLARVLLWRSIMTFYC